jgi:uncharacterized protein (DUF58 family)
MATPGQALQRSIDSLVDALQRATTGLTTGSLIFIIADLNREIVGLDLVLGSLIQRHTVVLIPVDDPADWNIPNMGRITFTSSNGELIEIDTANTTAQNNYHIAWQTRRNAVLSLVHRLGIFMLPIRTDADIHKTLLRGLEERARWRTL